MELTDNDVSYFGTNAQSKIIYARMWQHTQLNEKHGDISLQYCDFVLSMS